MRIKIDHKLIFLSLFMLIGVIAVWRIAKSFNSEENQVPRVISKLNLNQIDGLPQSVLELGKALSLEKTDLNCKMHSCFDVYKCGNSDANHITVYLYPLRHFVDTNSQLITPSLSREFYELYAAIASSPYYVDDPKFACLFVPPIDLLNQNGMNIDGVGRALLSLPYWNHGKNNLIFNMLPGKSPDFSTVLDVPHGKAIVAGGGFSHWTYRFGFDVSIPVYSPIAHASILHNGEVHRKWLVTSAQTNLHSEIMAELYRLSIENSVFQLLDKCRNIPDDTVTLNKTRCSGEQQLPYPQVLQDSTFCLILPSARLGQAVLSDAMKAGCIPVFVCDTYVLPFSEVLDWPRASLVVRESSLSDIVSILKRITPLKIQFMRQHVKFYYQEYFSSITAIAKTTLQIINGRVFPESAKTYNEWNTPHDMNSVHSPLFLPLTSPAETGFTAVILAYDRVKSLFQLISAIDKVPSLRMILVIWNNQEKPFPPRNDWPIVDHEWKVIQTTSNKLSNRFYPYDEIKTDAVLSIDDDIVMLTADEIEFGYQVWREYPDRLVGFPPRLHLWTTDNKLRYESEWKNNISIVLTGAAFYHNYFNYLYTYKMPGDIRDWVDNHMNCEDIAMNFIASNHTGKAPIKVTPRKKFKCSDCITGGSLSLDETHMVERSTCMNYFMNSYGMLPLKTVNFRADPVLFKDEFPEKLKRFPDLGSL